ncbi:hypothetical protein N9989_00165 [bacterium]|nr:hypothetical protein [bacterium]
MYDIVGSLLPVIRTNRIALNSSPGNRMRLDVNLYTEDKTFDDIDPAVTGRAVSTTGEVVESGDSFGVVDAIKVAVIITTSELARQQVNEKIRSGIQITNTTFEEVSESESIYFATTFAKKSTDLNFIANNIYLLRDPAASDVVSNSSNDLGARYPLRFTIEDLPTNLSYLDIQAFCYIDKTRLFEQFPELGLVGFPIESDSITETGEYLLSSIRGAGIEDLVISDGRLNPTSFILTRENGSQYTGPYHYHPPTESYMEGSFHQQTPHGTLTRVAVRNDKIQDFRGFSRSELNPYDFNTINVALNNFNALANESVKTIKSIIKTRNKNKLASQINNASITTERSPDNLVSGRILIDQGEVLRENSAFGFLYDGLLPKQKLYCLWWRDMFRLVNVKIVRRRLSNNLIGQDPNGYRDRKLFDENQIEEVIATGGEAHSTAIDNAASFLLTGIEDNLEYYDPESLVRVDKVRGSVRDKNWITEGHNFKNVIITSPAYAPSPLNPSQILFPWVREFIFEDKMFSSNRSLTGIYQYGIELTYEDGLMKYVFEVVDNLKKNKAFLQELSSQARNRFNYDNRTGQFTEAFNQYLQSKIAARVFLVSAYVDAMTLLASSAISQDEEIMARYANVYVGDEFSGSIFERATAGFLASFVGASNTGDLSRRFFNLIIDAVFNTNNGAFSPENLQSFYSFESQYDLLIGSLTDIMDLANNIDISASTFTRSSTSGRTPSLIRVKKYFKEVTGRGTGLSPMSVNGVMDMRNPTKMRAALLPGDIRPFYDSYSQRKLTELQQNESLKFNVEGASGEELDVLNKSIAYFTPNDFLGSVVVSGLGGPPGDVDLRTGIYFLIDLIRGKTFDREGFENLTGMSPRRIYEKTQEIASSLNQSSGVLTTIQMSVGTQNSNPNTPAVAECRALATSQIKALIKNQRKQESAERNFQSLVSFVEDGLRELSKVGEKNQGKKEDEQTQTVTSDTTGNSTEQYDLDSIRKAKEDQEMREAQRKAEESAAAEKARQASIDAAKQAAEAEKARLLQEKAERAAFDAAQREEQLKRQQEEAEYKQKQHQEQEALARAKETEARAAAAAARKAEDARLEEIKAFEARQAQEEANVRAAKAAQQQATAAKAEAEAEAARIQAELAAQKEAEAQQAAAERAEEERVAREKRERLEAERAAAEQKAKEEEENKRLNSIPWQALEALDKAEGVIGVDGKEISSSLYGNMYRFLRIVGYQRDRDGTPILSKPKTRPVTVEEMRAGLPPGVYIVEQYDNPSAGLEADETIEVVETEVTVDPQPVSEEILERIRTAGSLVDSLTAEKSRLSGVLKSARAKLASNAKSLDAVNRKIRDFVKKNGSKAAISKRLTQPRDYYAKVSKQLAEYIKETEAKIKRNDAELTAARAEQDRAREAASGSSESTSTESTADINLDGMSAGGSSASTVNY